MQLIEPNKRVDLMILLKITGEEIDYISYTT
jgi:hypothetical protein